jgi:hypothetical protein
VRHQIFLLAGGAHVVALLAFGCSFPDYGIVEPRLSGDGGGGASSASPQGGGGSEVVAGGAGSAGGENGENGGGGSPSAGSSGSNASGSAGLAGDGGEAGRPPAAPNKCADYPTLPADARCFDDATHAYLFRSETKPFTIAAAQCRFYDMHLVSIESPTEDAFILQSAGKITQPSQFDYFWIGGSTIGSPGTWHWTDGSVFWTGGTNGQQIGDAYFNWRSDSPMNTGSDSCAFSDDAGWQDGDCTQNRPYVCEAD